MKLKLVRDKSWPHPTQDSAHATYGIMDFYHWREGSYGLDWYVDFGTLPSVWKMMEDAVRWGKVRK